MSRLNGYSEHFAVGSAMVVYGGSFMQHIGRALQNADNNNATKIKTTWASDYDRYLFMAESMPQFKDHDNDR